MGRLDGKVAVVTGASRGIGRAIAGLFAREGAAVAGCSRTTTSGSFLDDVAAEAKSRCLHLACDIRRSEDVDRFRDEVRRGLGLVTTVVNNAGTVVRQSIDQLSATAWNDVIASNLTGTFLVTQAFLPDLRATRGRIINLSSIAGRTGTALLSAYCAAKHGIVGLTRSWAEELRSDGIVANAICPGSVDTDMLRQGLPGAEAKMSSDDIARVALFLACEAPTALTGACIDVFG